MQKFEVRTMEELAAALGSDGEKTVVVHEGLYSVTETLHVTSHTHIQAAPGEQVRFAGALRMDGSRAVRLTGGEIYDRVISEQAKRHIYTLDLSPYADEIPEIRDQYSRDMYLPMEFYQDGKLLRNARFPRENDPAYPQYEDGFTRNTGTEVLETYKREDLPRGYDGGLRATIRMADDVLERARHYSGATTEHLYMFAYLTQEWRDQTFRVLDFDLEKGTFLIDGPTVNGTARPNSRYYFFNLPEEITNPGDCYVDRENRVLYFYPYIDPAQSELLITVQEQPMFALEDVEDVSFENLCFNYTRGSAITAERVTGLTIDGCSFFGICGNAVVAEKGTGFYFLNNRMSYIGYRALTVEEYGDLPTLRSGEVYIINNDIGFVGRVRHTYSGAINCGGRTVGANILHNTLHDCPHMLVGFGGADRPSANINFAYNEIARAVYECDDAAAVYWGRSQMTVGLSIHDNYFHDIGNKYTKGHSNAIYCDDYSTDAHIYNNVFFRAALPKHDKEHRFSTSGCAIYGRANFAYIHNNIFVDNPTSCRLGFGHTTSILPRITTAVGVPYVLEVLGPRTDFFNLECNRTDGVDWLTRSYRDGFLSDIWKDTYRNTIWAGLWDVVNEEEMRRLSKMVADICGSEFYTKRQVEEHCDEIYEALLGYLEPNTHVNNRFIGNINIRGSAFVPPHGGRYPSTGDLMYADDAPVDNDIISYGNYTSDDDKTDTGVSMFVEYGKNFNLTEEGLEYIRRTVPDFEPFDMTQFGTGARVSLADIEPYELDRTPLPPLPEGYLALDADGKEEYLAARRAGGYHLEVTGDGKPWLHLEKSKEIPNIDGNPFFPYNEDDKTELAYVDGHCIVDRALLLTPKASVNTEDAYCLSAAIQAIAGQPIDLWNYSRFIIDIEHNDSVVQAWLSYGSFAGSGGYAVAEKVPSEHEGWDRYVYDFSRFRQTRIDTFGFHFDLCGNDRRASVRVGYLQLIPREDKA